LQPAPDDIALVEKLQTGDIEAFDLLYEKYSGKLYSFGLKYLRLSTEAEELVQSVFLKVWGNHKNLRKELSFKSFLFTIAYNEICNLFRERSYHQKFIEVTQQKDIQPSSEIEDSLDLKFVMENVQQIVDRLPERQKSIFLKSRMEGKSTKQIAEEIGLSPGTIDNYISDSLRFIRTRLKKENMTL
jgi:RNA polymerase sigma-70 factor (family 1)